MRSIPSPLDNDCLKQFLMDSDAELLEALKTGGESAWEKAFRRLYPCAFSAARHPTAALTPSEAEDVAIETLTQLVGKIAQVKKFEELKALAVTMAVRRAISVLRKKYAEKRGGNQTASLEQLNEESEGQFELAADRLESLSETDIIELSGLLDEMLASLDELTRELIRDYLLNGVAYKELALKHHIPIGTVGVTLHRGLAKMRRRLAQSPRLMKELRLFLR